jgi:hypothetical protein
VGVVVWINGPFSPGKTPPAPVLRSDGFAWPTVAGVGGDASLSGLGGCGETSQNERSVASHNDRVLDMR